MNSTLGSVVPLAMFLTMGGGWAKKGLMGKFFALVVKIPHYMDC